MNARTMIDMIEATRLTRQGRLQEAMAVLRGESPAPTKSESTHAESGHPKLRNVLRDVLDRLGRFRPVRGFAHPEPKHAPTPPVAPGARFETRSYANDSGSRAYKIYIPSGYTGQALPLVVMLHGCTQSPDDFAAGTRMNELAETEKFLVAYPAQDRGANPSKCWNWFNESDQRRDRGEPSLIAGMTRAVVEEFAVTPGRIYIAGLSAGGAAAAVMGATYPDLYAAIGVHSGLPCGAASDVPSAFAAMRQGAPRAALRPTAPVPTIVFHGDGDTTVNPINSDQIIAQSKATARLKMDISRGEAAGGIHYTRTIHADDSGRSVLEQWTLHGAGHAWSGGSDAGTYTEPRGPDASREMLRFFQLHATAT